MSPSLRSPAIGSWLRTSLIFLVGLPVIGSGTVATAERPCRIEVIDRENGWPVPLVELATTHHVRMVTDNNGLVAFDLPELMNVETWLHVRGHGYTVPADGFGMRGVRIVPRPGETLTIQVDRTLPAKRLGRLTGGGIFAESQKLGVELDWKEQRILGCDSVQNAVHQGKLFWGWGDTTLAHYPLGRFHMTGAITKTQPLSSFRPPFRLRFDYVTDSEGVPRDVARIPGDGPTWLNGYASLDAEGGETHLVATYAKIEPPLAEYERGLCVWDDSRQRFRPHRVLWKRGDGQGKPPKAPGGHTVRWTDPEGIDWVLCGDPFPMLKFRDRFEDWSDPERWIELQPQRSVSARDSDEKVIPHRGAIAWNEYLQRWVSIFTQLRGKNSSLGELWFAEADSPMGPWRDAQRVVTHDRYTFYNPQLHSEFTEPGSAILLFEATYTHTFSASKNPTPRHDYNQVLYRLDLDEVSGRVSANP